MKIKVELDEKLDQDEIIIRCSKLDSTIQRIQSAIADIVSSSEMIFSKEGKEYYLSLNEIIFFETNDNGIDAHTKDDMFKTKYRLYELEDVLPSDFIRVSKSTILNVNQIYSIDKNLVSSSVVQFYKTHKQVCVSRHYYRQLQERLERRRNI